MATFRIHEDIENLVRNGRPKRKLNEKANEISKKRACTRSVLQPLNNLDKRQAKRPVMGCTVKLTKMAQVTEPEVSKSEPVTEEDEPNKDCLELVDKNDNVVAIAEKEIADFPEVLQYNREYREDIWAYMKEREGTTGWPAPNYMRNQRSLTYAMRCILIDWMVAVVDEYKIGEQSLHLTVNYIDRFLSRVSVVKGRFQLLGAAAMMLASKVEEIYWPESKEWVTVSDSAFSIHQLLAMERLLLKTLNFELQPPTVLSFIQQLCADHDQDKQTLFLAMYLSELVLLEGEDYMQYLPSKLAAASVALARATLSKKMWPRKLADASGYTIKQLSPVVQRQHLTFRNSPTKAEQAIQSKYKTREYQRVALLEPKALDLADFGVE